MMQADLTINGEGLVLGRTASLVAKRLLKNQRILVVNAEKLVIVGDEKTIMEKCRWWANLRAKGNPKTGPKATKRPDFLFKETVRKMLPYRLTRGREALEKLRVAVGLPPGLQADSLQAWEDIRYQGSRKSMTLADIGEKLGGKW